MTTASLPTRAIVYVRQSDDREQSGDAVDRQRAACLEIAARNAWTVVRVIEDNATSATSRKIRPGFRELLREIESGATDVVLAWSTDRLSRRLRDTADLLDRCIAARVKIVTPTSTIDPGTPAGEFIATQMAGVARYEAAQKGLRQQAEQRQAAERGDPSGRRAFGYARGGRELHPAEAPAVRAAFEALFRGESVTAIARRLNATGLVTAAQGKPWSRHGVRALLTSARYAGIREFRKGTEDALTVPGTWPPIISEAELEKARALLADPIRTTTTGNARRWVGTGLFRCGQCGDPVRVVYRTNGSGRAYVCPRHHVARKADPVDTLVMRTIEARLAQPDVADLLAGEAAGPELAELRAARADLDRRLSVARDRLDRGVLDEEDFVITKRGIKREADAIDRKLSAAAASSRLAWVGASPDPAAAFRSADLNVQREIIATLITVTLLSTKSSPTFDPETVSIEWRS